MYTMYTRIYIYIYIRVYIVYIVYIYIYIYIYITEAASYDSNHTESRGPRVEGGMRARSCRAPPDAPSSYVILRRVVRDEGARGALADCKCWKTPAIRVNTCGVARGV